MSQAIINSMDKELKRRENIKTKLLLESVSKDETRPFLMGICHVSNMEAQVSLDGFIGTMLKSRYSEELADKIICSKTFQLINREYPKVGAMMPDVCKGELYKIKIEKHHYSKDVYIHIYEQETGTAVLSFERNLKDKTFLASIQTKHLRHLNTGLWINLKIYGELKPMLFDLSSIDNINTDNTDRMQFQDIYLIMPVKT